MSKRIALFMDGTWLSDESKVKSNVCVMYDGVCARSRIDGKEQLRQYQMGIGASGPWLWRVASGGTGMGLESNYMEMYAYLAQHYQPGDEIYLFGFSRGAYTARCLAGVIRKCGVLNPKYSTDSSALLAAWRLYIGDDHPNSEKAKAFREQYAYPEFVDPKDDFIIHFIGLFDTVGTLGVPGRIDKALMRLHDTSLSRYVHYAYHALAIDEHRKSFKACLWEPARDPLPGHEMIQTWFPGAHCDVGGSYPEHGLADCSLAWMTDKAVACGLDIDYLMFPNFKPRPAGTLHNSNTFPYNLMPPWGYRRPIDKPIRQEQVSKFTRQRIDLVDSYDPDNLMEYIRRENPPPIYTPLPSLAPPLPVQPPKKGFAHAMELLKGLVSLKASRDDLRGEAQINPQTESKNDSKDELKVDPRNESQSGSQDDSLDDKRDPRPAVGRATQWDGHEFIEMAVQSERWFAGFMGLFRRYTGESIGYLLLILALLLMAWAVVDTSPTSLNALVALDGAALGWIVGILLSPSDPGEHAQFRWILATISTFISGFILARLDIVFGAISAIAGNQAVVRWPLLFAGGLLLGSLATFIWRHGHSLNRGAS